MSEKTFNLVKACISGAEVIVVGVVTYCVNDAAIAASVNAAIVAACATAIEVCKKFVKA